MGDLTLCVADASWIREPFGTGHERKRALEALRDLAVDYDVLVTKSSAYVGVCDVLAGRVGRSKAVGSIPAAPTPAVEWMGHKHGLMPSNGITWHSGTNGVTLCGRRPGSDKGD